MHPANHDLAAQVREQGSRQRAHQSASQAHSPHVSRVRSLQSEESWIDISSRNSTSSLSSAGGDDTLTASRGLTASAFPRRRRVQRSYSAQTQSSRATNTTGITDSSQEEYEESESEQDPVLSSSNEDLQRTSLETAHSRRPVRRTPSDDSSDAHLSSSPEGAALNLDRQSESRLAASFRPQPNAFTHPPLHRHANSYQPEPEGYFSAAAPMVRAASTNTAVAPDYHRGSDPAVTPGPRTSNPSSSNATVRPRSHTPYNMIAPSHNMSVDHDAALRASLSTLLSCAAARRGVPKREAPQVQTLPAQNQQLAQGTLCLIPESELDKTASPATTTTRPEAQPRQLGLIREDEGSRPSRQRSPKRKSKSKSPTRALNHKRNRNSISGPVPHAAALDSAAAAALSPTTLWFLGVGALFLGGAVLFTAGYIQGREIGYVEGLSDAGGVGCRGEAAADGLKGMGRRGWRSATASASIWGVS